MLTGTYVASWAERAATGLRLHRDEINALNVFPIPDSDTGSNMTATMEAAVERMHGDHGPHGSAAVAATTVADVAASLASGAVVGARGNSGLVLSQLLRALADTAAISATGDLPVEELPGMLRRAEILVRRAVSQPVEGTIISVLHAAAEHADDQGDAPLEEVVAAARDAAVDALAATTGQLPALAEAGVVDAGGRGLVVILDALVDALADEPVDAPSGAAGNDTEAAAPAAPAEGGGAEIEVMFTFRGDVESLRTELNRRGNSVVVVPAEQEGTWRVHVHTLEGGTLIELAYSSGDVCDLRLEVLPPQQTTVRDGVAGAPVLAIVPGGGLQEIFAGAGAMVGDMPTIVGELRERGTGCIVLTNGQDTTELFGVLSSSSTTEATVVDTECFVGGLAALAVYSPESDLEENAEEMADAVSAQRWSTVDGGLAGLRGELDGLLADGGELVTVLYGDDIADGDVASFEQGVSRDHRNVEVHGYRARGLGASAQVGVE
ncbi:MAG: DAK2 domain-containing protein [Mycobacteriaceae bacterium]|uniref:DAK2 domain-containing protein n=1 Tax=Corynebacterium sp. TaxID=1720 RepID=UPI003F9BA2E4